VTTLCPGLTLTGFQARAGLDAALLKHMPTQNARDVAEAGYQAMMTGRRRIVTGPFNKFAVALMPFIPRALLLPLLGSLQERRREN
jgi:short-subunit dehydrogenase